MTFAESAVAVLSKYATFTGRSRRPEFWWWFLLLLVYAVLFAALALLIGSGTVGEVLVVAYSISMLAILVPSVAVVVRRLHDSGKSAWWLLLYLIPAVGGLLVLALMALPSTAGPNKYGP